MRVFRSLAPQPSCDERCRLRDWMEIIDGTTTRADTRRSHTSRRHAVSLAPHPNVASALLDNVKLVRYQMNPQENWGPAKAAVRGAPPK